MKRTEQKGEFGAGESGSDPAQQRWMRAVRRLWPVPAGLAAAGMLGAAAWTWYQPETYTSWGRMMVNVRLSLPEGAVYTEELGNFIGTQVALMQSPAVLRRAQVRARRELVSEELPRGLRVTVLPKTTVFVVSSTGREPRAARVFLQACMEEYLDLKKEMRTETSDTTLAGLTEELMRLERLLREGEQGLAEFQSTNSVVSVPETAHEAASFLGTLQQRLSVLECERDLMGVGVEAAATSGGATFGLPELASGAERGLRELSGLDEVKLRQQIRLLTTDAEELGRVFKPKHPKMIALREEIERRERLLAIHEAEECERSQVRREQLDQRIERLAREARTWEERASVSSRKAAELARLKAGVQRTQALYDRLLATLQTLDVNKEISPESVAIVEPASEGFRDRRPLVKHGMAGLVLGFLVGIGMVGFVARLDDRLRSSREVEEAFGEPVLAQVPWESCGNGPGPEFIAVADGRHGFAEAFRGLRSSLLFLEGMKGRGPRTLLCTSSVPGEGKSLVAANLALAMGQAGMRVLLVDADARRGELHRRFGVDSSPGLAQVLTGGIGWREAMKPTACEHVFLLPNGGARCEAHFVSRLAPQLLEPAREEFDLVIFDSPPVLAADDATTMAPGLENVLFLMRVGETSVRVARAALDLLQQRQARVLGLVLNGVTPGRGRHLPYQGYNEYASVAHSG